MFRVEGRSEGERRFTSGNAGDSFPVSCETRSRLYGPVQIAVKAPLAFGPVAYEPIGSCSPLFDCSVLAPKLFVTEEYDPHPFVRAV